MATNHMPLVRRTHADAVRAVTHQVVVQEAAEQLVSFALAGGALRVLNF